jgi:hypothetical protein
MARAEARCPFGRTAISEPGTVRRWEGSSEPDVQSSGAELVDLRRWRHLAQCEPNPREAPTVLADDPGRKKDGAVGVGKNFIGFFQEHLAFRGQADAARVAGQKSDAELALEIGHGLAERRLDDVQPAGRLAEALRLRHRPKVAQCLSSMALR